MAGCRSAVISWLHLLLGLFMSSPMASTKKAAQRFKMIDPVAVGHSSLKKLSRDGREVRVETLALNPPILHIKGLLTETEADDLVATARKESWAGSEMDVEDHRIKAYKDNLKDREGWLDMFMFFDKDGDGALSEKELVILARSVFQIGRHNHTELLRAHKLPFSQAPIAEEVVYKHRGFLKYFRKVRKKYPERGMRYSSHVWLAYPEHSLARRLRQYARHLTQWPKEVFEGPGEGLQIAHYKVGGHFSCHPDATREATRMATMIVFLNRPLGGGELVFPGADRADFEDIVDEPSFDSNCSDWGGCVGMGGVIVKPEKGDAVFWYNMQTDMLKRPGAYPRKELIMDRAIHCGSDVTAGEKYLATVWVHLPPGYEYDDGQRQEL